jgi:hypothetical protein
MVTMNEIIMAVNGLLVGRFPNDTVYVNLLPKDFERPSFFIEAGGVVRTEASRDLLMVEASITITCYTEVDGHYASDVEQLASRQGEVMGLFLPGFLAVGDRRLEVQAAEGSIDFTDSTVHLGFSYFDSRPLPASGLPPMGAVTTNIAPEG